MNIEQTIEYLKIERDCIDADSDSVEQLKLEMFNNSIQALERIKDHRWHDLLKNPNDLPAPMSENIFVFADWNHCCTDKYGLVDFSLDGTWCIADHELTEIKVYAWKYSDLDGNFEWDK